MIRVTYQGDVYLAKIDENVFEQWKQFYPQREVKILNNKTGDFSWVQVKELVLIATVSFF